MKAFYQLLEGIYDPNIFKAVFLAGGPGSGKSFVVGRTLGGLGLKVINSDEPFERYLKAVGLSMRMPDSEQAGHAIDGRLGIVIDGTGKNYDKLTSQATQLKQIGYDVSMVFVNTSLETALKRNEMRARKVPPRIAEQGWKDVQANLGKFQLYFGPNRFFVVDNNDHQEDLMQLSTKMISRAVRKSVNNPIATAWIANELKKKQATISPSAKLGRNIGKGGGGYVPK